jgi:TatD DNase family protein
MKKPYLVDSHCHLNYEGLVHRQDEAIENAHKAGVELMQTICTRLSEFEEIYQIAKKNPSVWASVGIHPHEAESINGGAERKTANSIDNKQPVSLGLSHEEILTKIIDCASLPKTIGIGETGLDYYYETASKNSQIESFKIHLEAASASGLPVIIHTRDAEDDTYNILKEHIARKPLKGLLHCFTGSADLAKKSLDLGLYISISGIITFKNAEDLRNTVKNIVPMDRLLVETDSPFLAPVPFRGKPCEPAYTRNTAEFIAEFKGTSLDRLAEQTTDNFLKLFDKVRV